MIGHDRGARVARRFALDYPDDLAGVALLDILPAEHVYDGLTAGEAARRYWHRIFHLVPELPEQLIVGREDAYLERFFGRAPNFSTGCTPTARTASTVARSSSPARWAPRSRTTAPPTRSTCRATALSVPRACG